MEGCEVRNLHDIILLGVNGSGKSTLGRELASVFNFAHLDVEDYYFYKTGVSYSGERPHQKRNELMLSDMKSMVHMWYGRYLQLG